MTPAIAGWAVTLISIPIYALLFHHIGVPGLAIASDIGMAISTLTLAILLHRNKLVNLRGLEYGELARALLAALISFAGTYWTVHETTNLLHLHRGHPTDFILIAIGTTTWALLATATLLATRSTLPRPVTAPQNLRRSLMNITLVGPAIPRRAPVRGVRRHESLRCSTRQARGSHPLVRCHGEAWKTLGILELVCAVGLIVPAALHWQADAHGGCRRDPGDGEPHIRSR